jgi:hypothetical protein
VGGVLNQWGRLNLTDETNIVLQAQEITKTLLRHKEKIGMVHTLVVE